MYSNLISFINALQVLTLLILKSLVKPSRNYDILFTDEETKVQSS